MIRESLPWFNGQIVFGEGPYLFTLQSPGIENIKVDFPSFEIDNRDCSDFAFDGLEDTRQITEDIEEYRIRYSCQDRQDLTLVVIMRVVRHSPVIRYRYRLFSENGAVLTKRDNRDNLVYTTIELEGYAGRLDEIQFSNFNPTVHSYVPHLRRLADHELRHGIDYMGPITVIENGNWAAILAYEHGSQHPDRFLEFLARRDMNRAEIVLRAVKGNYYSGQVITETTPFESIWLQLGAIPGASDTLLKHYRKFFLSYISENKESRKPYIFYNSWNYQERRKYFEDEPYLSHMNHERMKQEIEVAHKMGVDVFVIDTGWYTKTGDWLVNTKRFPDQLRDIKKLLDSYNMKLGLWFNPTVAAKTSEIYTNHPEYAMAFDGKPRYHSAIWETEESYSMCLASPYSDWYIDKMVDLYHELGVSYFKWDGIGQYGCNSPGHWHGTASNSAKERADCYAFELGKQMVRIVLEVSRRCPDIIVDFDITEQHRFVGLGFLAVGKYFLMNNGPYFHSFDIPRDVEINPDTINVFFYPGAARPRVCRQGMQYDFIVPAQLFLTHFFPDPPRLSQNNSIASMLLGGNGIWGDLLNLSQEDISFFREMLANYKHVATSVTSSYPVSKGFIGSSPEIYEKIDPDSGEGILAFFTVAEGKYTHITQPITVDSSTNVLGADSWEKIGDQLKITVELAKDEARVVFVHRRKNV